MLTTETIEAFPVPEGKSIKKLHDGRGLFLQIDARSKGWRFRFRHNGKDSLLSMGPYPAVSIEQARAKAAALREHLARGKDPAEERRKENDAIHTAVTRTFGVCAEDFNKAQAHREEKTKERHVRMFKHTARLHRRTLDSITRPEILQLLRTFENVGKRETAHRLGIYIAQVYRTARDDWYTGPDPTGAGFGKSLKPVQEEHQAALTDPETVGVLMLKADDDIFELVGANVRNALKLLARTAVRPGELAGAEWSEFDGDTWVIPKRRMKMRDGNRTDHIVPLSTQAQVILETQRPMTGHSRYVFVNGRSDGRPMSGGALSAALAALGYKDRQTPHGFRTTFKTLAQDVLHAERELVERSLAHKFGSSVEGAYDRSQRLDERRTLMQTYSDLLERLKSEALDRTAFTV